MNQTRIFLLSYITSKRIKLDSPSWSGFVANSKPDQPQLSSSIRLEVVHVLICIFLFLPTVIATEIMFIARCKSGGISIKAIKSLRYTSFVSLLKTKRL